jgi:hypothetical protein
MTPLDQIIREDLLGKIFAIDRKLFSFLSRCLNAEGYACRVTLPKDAEMFVLIEVVEGDPMKLSEETG